MAVKLTATLDDKITPAMKKMEKQLAATGKEADEFADEFRKAARELGTTEKELSDLERKIESLGKQSGMTGNQIRYKLFEEMKARNVSKFKGEINDLADSVDKLGRSSQNNGQAIRALLTGGFVAGGISKLKEIIKQTEGYKIASEQMFEAVFGENSVSGRTLSSFEKSVARGNTILLYLLGNIDKFHAKQQLIAASDQSYLDKAGLGVSKIPENAFENAAAGFARWEAKAKAEKDYYKFLDGLEKQFQDERRKVADAFWQRDAEQAHAAMEKEKQLIDRLWQRDAEQAAAFEKKLDDLRKQRREKEAKAADEDRARIANMLGAFQQNAGGGGPGGQPGVNPVNAYIDKLRPKVLKSLADEKAAQSRGVFQDTQKEKAAEFAKRREALRGDLSIQGPDLLKRMKALDREESAWNRGLLREQKADEGRARRDVLRGKFTPEEFARQQNVVASIDIDRQVRAGKMTSQQGNDTKELVRQGGEQTARLQSIDNGIKGLTDAILNSGRRGRRQPPINRGGAQQRGRGNGFG